jgi:hypothetical protein
MRIPVESNNYKVFVCIFSCEGSWSMLAHFIYSILVDRVQDVSGNPPSLTYPIHDDLHAVRHSQRLSGALKHKRHTKHNSEVQKKLKQEVGHFVLLFAVE